MADKRKLQMNGLLKYESDNIFRAVHSPPDLIELAEDWQLMKARLQYWRDRTLVTINMVFESSN